uniref:Uncharacterized protein n=1 Tax=Anguilla anguilla TaxID=7936 RepID=A0A0E9S7N0_ANGAN
MMLISYHSVPVYRKNVEKRCLLENLDGVFLVVDEIHRWRVSV